MKKLGQQTLFLKWLQSHIMQEVLKHPQPGQEGQIPRVNNGNCFTVQWREDENNNAKNFDSTLYYNGTSDGGGRSEVTGISTFYYHYDSWISMVRRHGNIVITYHPSNSTGWKFCGVYSSESSSNGTSINYNYTWYKYGSSAPTTSSSGWKATSDMSGRCYVIYRYRYKLVFNGNGGTTNIDNQYFYRVQIQLLQQQRFLQELGMNGWVGIEIKMLQQLNIVIKRL